MGGPAHMHAPLAASIHPPPPPHLRGERRARRVWLPLHTPPTGSQAKAKHPRKPESNAEPQRPLPGNGEPGSPTSWAGATESRAPWGAALCRPVLGAGTLQAWHATPQPWLHSLTGERGAPRVNLRVPVSVSPSSGPAQTVLPPQDPSWSLSRMKPGPFLSPPCPRVGGPGDLSHLT